MTQTDDGWEPIETAPRDGTVILVAYRAGVEMAKWGSLNMSSATTGVLSGWTIPKLGWRIDGVTHWRPHPPPPKGDR